MSFICDENTDSKGFVRDCNESEHEILWRYPGSLRGVADEEMLPVIMAGQRSLVTNDALMAEMHGRSIPRDNPGIIVVRLRRPTRTMTIEMTRTLVARFKAAFPQWASFDWSNTHLEVCEDGAIVCRLPLDGKRQVVQYSNDFAEALTQAVSNVRSSTSLGR